MPTYHPHCQYPGCTEPTGTKYGKYCHRHREMARVSSPTGQQRHCRMCGFPISHYNHSGLCKVCYDSGKPRSAWDVPSGIPVCCSDGERYGIVTGSAPLAKLPPYWPPGGGAYTQLRDRMSVTE
jgi:hypothetical protein